MRQTFKFGHKNNSVQNTFLVEPNLRGGFQDFHQRAAQLCYRQPSLVGSCLHTPAAARTRSSSLAISDKERLSTPYPVKQLLGEVLPIWQPMPRPPIQHRHTATTKQQSSYNIAPCDKHSNSVTTTTPVKTKFWLNPASVEGSKTFFNELRSSATGNQFRLECVPHHPQQPGLEARFWYFRQRTTEPLLAL